MPSTFIASKCKRACAAAALIVLAGAIKDSTAFSLDEMYSPNVEYREIAIEYNGARSFDPHPNKNYAQLGEATLEAGLTPRFQAGISGEYSRIPGSTLQLVAHQIEVRYQFAEPGEQWIDVGMLAAYDFSGQGSTPDFLETKLLLQKDAGKFTHTANIGFSQNVGQFSAHTGGPDYVFLWNMRYRYDVSFQPGIEVQSDLGAGSTRGSFNAQEHYIGPSAYGKLFGHVRYQVAYLAGLSDAAARNAARLKIEYEMPF